MVLTRPCKRRLFWHVESVYSFLPGQHLWLIHALRGSAFAWLEVTFFAAPLHFECDLLHVVACRWRLKRWWTPWQGS
jgi:hypothetical protein